MYSVTFSFYFDQHGNKQITAWILFLIKFAALVFWIIFVTDPSDAS